MSCRHSPDEVQQGSAAQIARTIEMLRKASNHDKQLWLNRLRQLPCKSTDVCQFKTLCTEAYEAHLGGVDLIEQARKATTLGNTGSADASTDAMAHILAGVEIAQRQLKSAKMQTQSCAENEAVIRQRYHL
jgi:hypothetical protein